jgi:hypothetical protein
LRDTREHYIKEILERDFKRVNMFDTEKGGVYIETTDDPRGWVLGDNTRKIFEIEHTIMLTLTTLLVAVVPNHNGENIKVIVYDSKNIGRMLLSKNDDVGSSIQYADIVDSLPTELTATMGQHITVEPLDIGNWIRLRIYPGSHISTLNIDGSKIFEVFLQLIKSTDMPVKESLQKLFNMYYSTEKEIDILLSELRNHGKSCDCKSPIVFKQIHEGEFDEIIKTCIECGGIID